MVRLAFCAVALVVGACKFDQGGLPQENDGSVDQSDGSTCTVGTELCNAEDDDCDGQTDEDFTTLTMPCDGDDGDDCQEGVLVCNEAGTGVTCNDTGDTVLETCNAADDDCDGYMDEGFDVGLSCDGDNDTDVCPEGVWQCDGLGGAECTDATGSTVEVCDTLDNDCDGPSDEDFDFDNSEVTCGDCDTTCFALNGSNECLSGTCTPSCIGGAQDCDGNPNNGCEMRNTNPTCAVDAVNLGSIRGDDGSGATLVSMGGIFAEAWFQVTVTETTLSGGGEISANIDLAVPPGVDFDLYAYCASCAAPSAFDSSATVGEGLDEQVQVGNAATNGTDTFTVLIEVRFQSASICGDYTITVTGNVDNALDTCPAG